MNRFRKTPRPSSGLARVLSKRGICSRSQAFEWVRAGRVAVNGVIVRDPMASVAEKARIEVDGERAAAKQVEVYIMLNKPRGLVTTTADEQGRDTVFSCLAGSGLPRLVAVGRLDKASEGLLLLTNDTVGAARITDPATHLNKTYHVQIDVVADDALLTRMLDGVEEHGELLKAKSASLVRTGEKHSWLEIVLDEGRNRHIRRLLDALGVSVLRLIRISIGSLTLGDLPKGKWRRLSPEDLQQLR